MDSAALSVGLQYLTVVGIVGAAAVSFAAAFAVGPGKDFLALRFLDERSVSSDPANGTTFGRKLRRPNRASLRDPDKRLKAIQGYRDRAQAALASGSAPSNIAMQSAFGRLGLVVLLTFGLATLAFAAFVGSHAFLFSDAKGFQSPSIDFWQSVAWLVVEHIRSAFAFNSIACAGNQPTFKLIGIGMEEASQFYRLMMAWSVPVIVQRTMRAGSLLFNRSHFDRELLRIANANDDELLVDLAAYAQE